MARAIWSGAISFGLVNVPVKLYNAVSRRDVRFNMLHEPDGSRIQQKRVCAAEGVEVPLDEIVKGYEVSKGRFVVVTTEELESLRPAATHQIAIDEFVDGAQLDPVVYEASYHAAPEKGAAKAYALLRDAMRDADRVGLGRFMLRSRESLAAIRATDVGLVVSTLAYADELVPATSLPGLDDLAVEPTERELQMARLLIESMTVPLELERHRDTYRDQVLDLIERKAAGEAIATPEPAADAGGPVADIMAALEASLAAAKARSGGDDVDEAPAPRRGRRAKTA